MTFYGPLTIGRLTLTEDFTVKETGSSGREMAVSGQESWPPLPDADSVRYRGEQLMAMEDQIVPVMFSSKSDRNGFYIVNNPSVNYTNYDGNVSIADWSVSLKRLGNESETFFESRLIGGNRLSYYGGNVAERWHSPSASHQGYYTGASIPGSMTRTGSEGALTIYRGLAPDVSPRWGSAPSTYMRGASRITVNGSIRTGMTCPNTPLDWSIDNTLMKVGLDTNNATFRIWFYRSGLYQDTYTDLYGSGSFISPKSWIINIDGIATQSPAYVSILRNSPEECIVRTTHQNQTGFSTVDYSLRRGSRFVSIFAQHGDATTFALFPITAPSAATDSGNGYIYQTSNDSDGNRFVTGSASNINVITSAGYIESVNPATSFSMFAGIERNGTSAQDGDRAVDLAAQYLGQPSEVVKAVHR